MAAKWMEVSAIAAAYSLTGSPPLLPWQLMAIAISVDSY